MIFQLCVLLSAFLLCYLFLVYYVNGGLRKNQQPAILRGKIPYLGVALEFGKNPLEFVLKNQEKYGKLFSIYMIGRVLHIIVDPITATKIYKNTKTFGVEKISRESGKKICAIPDELIELGWLEKTGDLIRKNFQGQDLTELTQKYFHTFKCHILESYGKEWSKEDFLSL
jgi:hypothetical protein